MLESNRAGHVPDAETPLSPPLAPCDGSASIESLLLLWQSTGSHEHLERLVTAIRPVAEKMARDTLHGRGVHDRFSVDEAIALVLDHLRRLPGPAHGERSVAPFTPRTNTWCMRSHIDPGQAYILWLTRERAADVARARRRWGRRATLFSQLDAAAIRQVQDCAAASTACEPDENVHSDLVPQLHNAIVRLPPRERLVLELLLEGKTQAVISHALNCCEGTVSRIRARAIGALRDLLAE